ncbi:hypothetical protein Tco_1307152, partial [Tanacetum coccineum]
TPGLDLVPSLEALEMTVDSSRTPSMLHVPSFEPPVLGCLLLIFLLSLRAFIMSAASCSAGVKESQKAIPDCLLCVGSGSDSAYASDLCQ